jgi:hypothetical protein
MSRQVQTLENSVLGQLFLSPGLGISSLDFSHPHAIPTDVLSCLGRCALIPDP